MFLTYLLIRLFTFPLSFLSISVLQTLGKGFGTLAYYLFPKFRKRAESNLSLAESLQLTPEKARILAKKSIQHVMITLLEYPKLARIKEIHKVVTCENPTEAKDLLNSGKGVIFFCGHQANWELLFLEGTSRMPGVAIGRPIKNSHLYSWITKTREKYGGKMIPPKNAIKEGLRGLKKGAFLGIVGDQGMPDSGFYSPFLGRGAYTSPMPALLSYKTGAPIIVATTVRRKGHYTIHYSPPLFPNLKAEKEGEIRRLMEEALTLYEKSILDHPEQWLWIHNRWKQQTLDQIKRPFRQDSLALFMPADETLAKQLPLIREMYPTETITAYIPSGLSIEEAKGIEIKRYQGLEETLIDDLRHKLIFNFTKDPRICKHYLKRSAVKALNVSSFEEIKKEALHA